MSRNLLEIRGLRVEVEGREILRGLDLELPSGATHAVMGPNGSGKSTLAYVIAGREGYEITGGSIRFRGEDIAEAPPEERARAGLFLAFQYPRRDSRGEQHLLPEGSGERDPQAPGTARARRGGLPRPDARPG